MLDILILLISWAFMITGCVFVVSGSVGLMRMPDFYTRLHAASLTDTLAKTALLCGRVPTDRAGKPLLDSPEEATMLARSRPADYRHGQDAQRITQQMQALDEKREGQS